MSQTPQNEKKSRFQLSREVQEEFVNGIAQTMLSLAENAEQGQPSVAETPFCPVTGKEYSGANMVRLALTAMEKGYADNRWLTFKQLQAVREEHPDLNIRIRKGEHGVTVLSNEALVLERNGDALVLAGIDDPNGYADQKTPQELAAEIYAAYGDPFWLLLAHRNDRFEGEYSLLGADLVISGHGHGGIIRLPFTDGLISTDRTLFPSYTAGLYEKNGSALFVTRGLGNSGPSFRLFNRPEVAVVTLHRGG